MDSLQLGQKVINRINEEDKNYYPQKAHGCVIVKDEKNQNKTFWLIPGQLKHSHTPIRNIVGDIVDVQSGPSYFLKIRGEPTVSKNSPFGNAFAESEFGTGPISYKTENAKIKLHILSNILYKIKRNEIDAYQGRILTQESDGFEFENSLIDELKRLSELKELLRKAKDLSEEAKQEKIAEIKELEREIKEKRRTARKRRRTTASIREQFILDPEQNKVKRSKLLNGPLIIDGGPGTGKTTLLIHRIQYMLDAEIENDELLTISLSNEERSFIRNQKTGWIFFSPTTLLKKYLENAMASEGLEAHDETVRIWEQHRASLKTAMGLFNAETGRPFQAYRSTEHLWKLSVKEVVQLQTEFDNYLKEFFSAKIIKLSNLILKGMPWQKEADNVIMALKPSKANFRMEGFILTLNELFNQYGSLRSAIDKEYRSQMDDIAGRIQQRLTAVEKDWFAALLRERRKKNEAEDENEEAETEEMITAFEEEEIIEGKRLEVDINKLIKRVIRIDALAEIDSNTRLSKGDKEIIGKIQSYINKEKYPLIASHSLFIKYFKPFLRGSDTYILSQFSRIYKSFRKEIIKNLEWLPGNTKEKLKEIIEATPKNTRIHEDELDFLLYLVLKTARLFYTTTPIIFKESSHPILLSYNMHMKGLVAIDEAPDFTPLQIGCIYLLSRPRLNSLTLSGDLMQQMNERGIDNWDDLSVLLPGIETRSLFKSYRQTPKLLKLAVALYKNRFGTEPGFFAAENDDNDDPDPLILIEQDFELKINWIAHRVAELYNIYEQTIPNVAIFVKNDEQIQKCATALNENDIFVRNMITAKACIGEGEIGSAEFIRVFNINLIKGMEFESVFFLDVDEYEDADILDKLIYVGVSRATYYLAITLNKSFPERLLPVKDLLKEGTWNNEAISDY